MLTYRDSVLERTKLTIDNGNDAIRDEIRGEINNVCSLMFSIKPYKDEFWFNEEQVNYLNKNK